MKMPGFSSNSHPSPYDVLRIGGGVAKGTEGCCEVLLLVGIRGGNNGTSYVDNRVIKARMGCSAANRLLLGGFPFPLQCVCICIPGGPGAILCIFLGNWNWNWPEISWPEKVKLRRCGSSLSPWFSLVFETVEPRFQIVCAFPCRQARVPAHEKPRPSVCGPGSIRN
jgi:hypothetical protein